MAFTESDTWALFASLFFIATDYLTGIIKAIMQNNLSSRKMREGLGHKFAYLVLITIAYAIDTVNTHVSLGLPINVFIATVGGVCLIELTSILENVCEINPELKDKPFMKIFTTDSDSASDHRE